jgi:hypothetical protein
MSRQAHGTSRVVKRRRQPIQTARFPQAEAAFAVQASALNAAAQTANPALFQRLEHMRQARETTHQ